MITDYRSFLPNISSKQIQWIVKKATPTITLSKSSLSLNTNSLTGTFTITRQGNGIISVSSSNTSIATVSLSGTTAKVTAKANGSCTITINVAASADGNYFSNSRTLSVTCTLTQSLASCTPAQIQSIVNEGKAAVNWSVGDTTATITMSGNVSDSLTLSNYQCKAILIGLDHNKTKETDGKSSAYFILGKDTSNNEIAFCDWTGEGGGGGNRQSGTGFNHNNSSSGYPYGRNLGGWKSSNLRTNIMSKFKSALPSDWQNILGTVTKYTDNYGNGFSSADKISSTSDQLFLLAEWEVFGYRYYANEVEQNYQQQYTYFANGNGKIRKNHRSTGTAVYWWLRSVDATDTSFFTCVDKDGTHSFQSANSVLGVVPGFAIVQS